MVTALAELTVTEKLTTNSKAVQQLLWLVKDSKVQRKGTLRKEYLIQVLEVMEDFPEEVTAHLSTMRGQHVQNTGSKKREQTWR